MPCFEIREGKAWHCGAISRALRYEHQKAILLLGVNAHQELRGIFDASIYRKSWFIDGRLAGVGGVTGTAVSSYGVIWVAFTNEATKYPLALTKEMQHQLSVIMETRKLLQCTIMEGDEASERFAIFLGFVPADCIEPAVSRFGRREIARNMELARIPAGAGYVRVMEYRGE